MPGGFQPNHKPVYEGLAAQILIACWPISEVHLAIAPAMLTSEEQIRLLSSVQATQNNLSNREAR